MARKRISESDLLDFESRAAELSQAVESKYEELDKLKKPEPEPMREMGLLLLPDAAEGTTGLSRFAQRMGKRGCAIELVDILGYAARDRFDRTPEWQRRLSQAQIGYLALKARARKVAVLGAGTSCALATLIAEQYTVDALITVGGRLGKSWGRTGRLGSPRISRIARNNLFSIVCPLLAVEAEGAEDKRNPLFTVTRSRDARRVSLPAAGDRSLWEAREEELARAVTAFLAEV